MATNQPTDTATVAIEASLTADHFTYTVNEPSNTWHMHVEIDLRREL